MKRTIWILSFCLCTLNLFSTQFGYVGCSTENLGDDVQSIAAKRFLPPNSIQIDRDFIGKFQSSTEIPSIVNGWFMWQNNFYNPSKEFKYNWPPSDCIKPLLISMHFTPHFVPIVLSDENKQYLIDNGPVGARDYYTLDILKKNDIPCYFSGCLTLTLENNEIERTDIVYAVDIDEECLNYLKVHSPYPVEEVTHALNINERLNAEVRLNLTESLLDKYRKAKYVITTRLHAAMPCLAFNTPVLLITLSEDECRFYGLKELTRNCSRKSFLEGKSDFDLNDPGENSQLHIPIRNDLIQTVTEWIHSHSMGSIH